MEFYDKIVESLNDNGVIADFNIANAITDSFKFKEKIRGQTGKNGTKNVRIMVRPKKVALFWKIDRVKKFLSLPHRIIKCVSEYIYFQKTNKQKIKQTKKQTKKQEDKKEKKLNKNREYVWKI